MQPMHLPRFHLEIDSVVKLKIREHHYLSHVDFLMVTESALLAVWGRDRGKQRLRLSLYAIDRHFTVLGHMTSKMSWWPISQGHGHLV